MLFCVTLYEDSRSIGVNRLRATMVYNAQLAAASPPPRRTMRSRWTAPVRLRATVVLPPWTLCARSCAIPCTGRVFQADTLGVALQGFFRHQHERRFNVSFYPRGSRSLREHRAA